MSCTSAFSLIEPLESRIAPSGIIVTVGGSGDNYSNQTKQQPWFSTDPSKANYDPTDPFGANFVGGSNTYYIKLSAGDVIKAFGSEGYKDELIRVTSGTVIAFFTDYGGDPQNPTADNTYETGELTGISIGKNASVIVKGSVAGDIVGNYNDATGKIVANPNTPDLAKWWVGQSMGSLVVDNADSVVFGGTIKNFTGKVVNRVLAGDASNGLTYDFNYVDSGGGDTLGFTLPDKQGGSGIQNVTLVGTDVVHAGNGGAGASGGSISGITITSDSDGFVLQAGNGGDNTAVISGGGSGGSISKVYAQGNNDTTANSPGINPQTDQIDPSLPAIQILAGHGGSAPLQVSGKTTNGGSGGGVSNVYVGYELVSGKLTASTFLVQDSVLIQAGLGGSGKIGGSGGAVNNAKVLTITPDDTNPTHPQHEIEIGAGVGGANIFAVSGGKSGSGGSLSNLEVRAINAAELSADVYLHAGDGGTTQAAGGNGGGVSNATLISYHLTVTAGNGASATDASWGTTAGSGGSLSSITVPVSPEGIIPDTVVLTAGVGGDSVLSNGGSGGNVSKVTLSQVDASLIAISAGNAGNGLGQLAGKGGGGGSVSNVTIADGDFSHSAITGSMTLTAGNGGYGSTSGGNGGSMSVIQFTGDDLSFVAQSGNGGNGSNGSGGNGGSISNAAFSSSDKDGAQTYTGLVQSGYGGKSSFNGAGGNGGNITQVTLKADSSVQLLGGNGGIGSNKSAGNGSSLKNVGGFSELGSATLQAGNAGTSGTNPANGGSINSASILAHQNVSVLAGNGSLGGSGGSISSVGYSDSTAGQEPLGSITILAGNGSTGAASAGSGGSINSLSGFVGDTGLTQIRAGNGAGSVDGLKGGTGGSIQHLALYGGGNASGTELQIQAGDAGNSVNAKTGAKGGDVKDVAVTKLSMQSIFRYIIAGDGGNALSNGGAGGTIDQVTVRGDSPTNPSNGDIGVRSGANIEFGYMAVDANHQAMGGLFAGAGGTGAVSAGVSGNVTNVRADAIAAIVAGKLKVGDTITGRNLANKVDAIVLNNSIKPNLFPNPNDPTTGSFTNWDTANMLGAIINPTDPTAATFELSESEWGDAAGNGNVGQFGIGDTITNKTDGFVAAVTYPTGKLNRNNVVAEALLTVSNTSLAASDTNSKFIDNNNQY